MLLIFLPVITPRCEYVFELIFKEKFDIQYQLTTDVKTFETYEHEKLNYSFKPLSNEFYIQATSLLFEQEIKKVDITIEKKFGTIVFFCSEPSCDIGFDIFSAVFYMISRYEEYLPYTPDKYGRYKASESLAYRYNFLQNPVVEIWINIFRGILSKRFPYLHLKPSKFRYILTYDIDIAYAFKGRNMFRNMGATIKDVSRLKLKNIFNRIQSLTNIKKDPWDVYDVLCETIVKNKMHSIFFFLMADYSEYDKNISYTHHLMKHLISKVSACSEIGIHPSFKSSVTPKKILIEKERLEMISGKKINKSRQHFLKFTLPETYNHLINAGITEDYSMGYADMPGFRAGTCKPFYFYDLIKEKSTGLRVFPFAVMESSFINYLQVPPHKALERILKILEEVKNVNGAFISIWHNDSLSETNMYKGWKEVHDKMIEQILLYA
ncbi:MAG: polysaccharide deacetylase family protein [Ginsengibacter sp.]